MKQYCEVTRDHFLVGARGFPHDISGSLLFQSHNTPAQYLRYFNRCQLFICDKIGGSGRLFVRWRARWKLCCRTAALLNNAKPD
jgi:hypothetical protein